MLTVSATLILRDPTTDEQAAEDFDPIPCIAPAHGGVTLQPFVLATPDGAGGYHACFPDWPTEAWLSQVAVRYSGLIPPTYLPLRNTHHLLPGDELVIRLNSRHFFR